MLAVKTIVVSCALALSGLFAAGCEASNKSPQSALVSTSQGVACD